MPKLHQLRCDACRLVLGVTTVEHTTGHLCGPCGARMDLMIVGDPSCNPGYGWTLRDGLLFNHVTKALETKE